MIIALDISSKINLVFYIVIIFSSSNKSKLSDKSCDINTRPGLTLFCMALTLSIGLSSLSSGAFSQSSAFTLDVESINEIREQCGLSKVPEETDVSGVLESFFNDNPIQIPINQPIALVFIAAALQFIPQLL
jgi:hypothetical protein